MADQPRRADARRNRDKLVDAARELAVAPDGALTLEGIARRAGVGIGTLYRHFPTREALVEASYAAELDELLDSAPRLLRRRPADRALREWIDRYAAFAALKRAMVGALLAGAGSGRPATSATRERVTATIGLLLAAGTADGTLRADVEPDDVTAVLLGVFLSSAADGSPGQRARVLDLVVDGLRPRA